MRPKAALLHKRNFSMNFDEAGYHPTRERCTDRCPFGIVATSDVGLPRLRNRSRDFRQDAAVKGAEEAGVAPSREEPRHESDAAPTAPPTAIAMGPKAAPTCIPKPARVRRGPRVYRQETHAARL